MPPDIFAHWVLRACSSVPAEIFHYIDLNRLPQQPASRFKAYYLGLPEANGLSLKQDIERVVPPEARQVDQQGINWGWLYLHEFDQGGKAEYMKGRHRTTFIASCYFTVLIDQAFYRHYRELHTRLEQLAFPIKLTGATTPNLNPSSLLKVNYLRDDLNADCAFQEAIPVFEEHVKGLVREHFPELEPDQVWATVGGYIPKDRPYFQ